MECINCKKETNNLKFCSRSCSASYNNKGVRRHGTKRYCALCGQRTLNEKYCSVEHQQQHQLDERVRIWKEGGSINIGPLKRYLAQQKEGCWTCGITEWQEKPLVLDLEHIDGNAENDDESNLALLCPNCHSQTSTYKGRNRGNGRWVRKQRFKEGKSY